MQLTLESFWRVILPFARPAATNKLVKGWSVEAEGVPGFQEAPLELSTELNPDTDPKASPIIFVSAPGAVGKTTLAKQISFILAPYTSILRVLIRSVETRSAAGW